MSEYEYWEVTEKDMDDPLDAIVREACPSEMHRDRGSEMRNGVISEARKRAARKHAKRMRVCPHCGRQFRGNGGWSSHKARIRRLTLSDEARAALAAHEEGRRA